MNGGPIEHGATCHPPTTERLALAHRSWEITGDDEVADDIEDRMLAGAEPDERERRS